MANNIMRTQKAFTLTELAIGILIAAIAGAAISLSSLSAKQTAKHEAERVAAYIYRMVQKADRIHRGFWMNTNPGYIYINWNSGPEDDSFKASPGCSYEGFFKEGNLTYNISDKRFPGGGHITITDSAGEKYYVIFAAVEEGRIRIDEKL